MRPAARETRTQVGTKRRCLLYVRHARPKQGMSTRREMWDAPQSCETYSPSHRGRPSLSCDLLQLLTTRMIGGPDRCAPAADAGVSRTLRLLLFLWLFDLPIAIRFATRHSWDARRTMTVVGRSCRIL